MASVPRSNVCGSRAGGVSRSLASSLPRTPSCRSGPPRLRRGVGAAAAALPAPRPGQGELELGFALGMRTMPPSHAFSAGRWTRRRLGERDPQPARLRRSPQPRPAQRLSTQRKAGASARTVSSGGVEARLPHLEVDVGATRPVREPVGDCGAQRVVTLDAPGEKFQADVLAVGPEAGPRLQHPALDVGDHPGPTASARQALRGQDPGIRQAQEEAEIVDREHERPVRRRAPRGRPAAAASADPPSRPGVPWRRPPRCAPRGTGSRARPRPPRLPG